MRFGRSGWWALLAPAIVTAATAQPLTCETFRDRLDGNLMAGAAEKTEAPTYREKAASRDGRRFAWSTADLEGTLTCGSDAGFREFYVALKVASKERFVDQLKRFVALNGAAICAVGEAPLPLCSDVGKNLLQIGLEQMGTAYKKQVTAPSGIARRTLLPHLTADLTVTPSFLTFSLDVDGGFTIDAARPPLTPDPPAPTP